MGRKKSTKKTSKARRKKQESTIGLDFIGGILIAIGVILFVMLSFENTSGFALAISEILGGLFGILKIAIPIVFAIVGIKCIVLDKEIYPLSEIIKGLVLVCIIAGTVYSFAYDKLFTPSSASEYVKWAWVGGITGKNIAGLIGGMITSSIASFIGVIVTRLILVILTLFVGLYFFDIGLRQLLFGICNFFMTILEWFINMFKEVFEKDEDEIEEKEARRLFIMTK